MRLKSYVAVSSKVIGFGTDRRNGRVLADLMIFYYPSYLGYEDRISDLFASIIVIIVIN